MITKDLYLGIFMILLSLLALIETRSYPVDSAYFPRFIILLIALLGVATILKELKQFLKNRKTNQSGPIPEDQLDGRGGLKDNGSNEQSDHTDDDSL